CTQGHPLVTLQKTTQMDAGASRSMRPEMAVPVAGQGNVPQNRMHSFSSPASPAGTMGAGNGSSPSVQFPTRWSSSMYNIKIEIHAQIESGIAAALHTLRSFLLAEVYLQQVKKMEDAWAATQPGTEPSISERDL